MDNIKVIVFLIDKVLFLYLPNFLFPIFSKNFPDRLPPTNKGDLFIIFSLARQSLLPLKAVAKIKNLIPNLQIFFKLFFSANFAQNPMFPSGPSVR